MFENHQSNGGTLDGVLDKRVLAAIMQGAERLPEKNFYEDGTVTIGDYTYKRVVDEHGNTIIKIYDKDNNLVGMQVITADGQIGSTEGDNPTIIKNNDGTYSYKVPNGNGTVEYVYDKDGRLIETIYYDETGKPVQAITHTNDDGEYDENVSERYDYEDGKPTIKYVLDGEGNIKEVYKWDPTTETWVLNTSTMRIHYPSCNDVVKIKPENYATSSLSLAELEAAGYKTCGHCFK
jgi:hypothetical protein